MTPHGQPRSSQKSSNLPTGSGVFPRVSPSPDTPKDNHFFSFGFAVPPDYTPGIGSIGSRRRERCRSTFRAAMGDVMARDGMATDASAERSANTVSPARADAHFRVRWATLVKPHLGWVYAVARRRLGDAALAEDVAQEVCIAFWRQRPWRTGDGDAAGWLLRRTWYVCNNLARSEGRRRARERRAATIRAEDGHWRKENLPDTALLAALDEGLLALSPADRSILVARFYQRQSVRQVAQVFGITETAAKSRISRAVTRLRTVVLRRDPSAGAPLPAISLIAGKGAGLASLVEKVLRITKPCLAAPRHIAGVTWKCSLGGVRVPVIAAAVAAPVAAAAAVICLAPHYPSPSPLHIYRPAVAIQRPRPVVNRKPEINPRKTKPTAATEFATGIKNPTLERSGVTVAPHSSALPAIASPPPHNSQHKIIRPTKQPPRVMAAPVQVAANPPRIIQRPPGYEPTELDAPDPIPNVEAQAPMAGR